MTKPVEPLPARVADPRVEPLTRSMLVKIQEYVRKNGVNLNAVEYLLIKTRCVEAVLKDGTRRVIST